MDIVAFRPYLEATAMGLGVGFERDWHHRFDEQQSAGSRTFATLGLAGAVAASLSDSAVAAGAIGVAALLVAGYLRTARTDRGTTTEAAGLTTYLLGALLWHNAELAIGLAVVMVVLLAAKAPLHHLSREVMTKTELDDALRFFVIAFVVLPVVPDRNVGPYGVLNPSRIWVLVVALTGINWAGYIAVRALGRRRGLLVTGLAGGFISATATTASLGRRARGDPSQLGAAVGGALLASAATLIQLALVTGGANRHLFAPILPALAVGLTAIAVEGGATYRSESIRRVRSNPGQVVGASEAEPSGDAAIGRSRPFALWPALLLAGLLTVVLLVARSGAEIAGSRGALLTSGLAGFADVHAAVVAAATLAAGNSITLRTAMIATTIALAANTAAKCALAFGIGGRRFGIRFSALLAVPVAVTAITLLVRLP